MCCRPGELQELRLPTQRSARSVELHIVRFPYDLLEPVLLEVRHETHGRGSGMIVLGNIADLVCSLADLLDDLRLLLRRGFETQLHALHVLQTAQNASRLHLQDVDGIHHTEAHDDLAEDGGDQWSQDVHGPLNPNAGAELGNVFVQSGVECVLREVKVFCRDHRHNTFDVQPRHVDQAKQVVDTSKAARCAKEHDHRRRFWNQNPLVVLAVLEEHGELAWVVSHQREQ
mmetsp:Transcript_145766/g.467084  ORF Transcript_145766/g.467084 Transcript_145766/m.467084 type:complete len:229 (-) Transcript_145766:2970-3656(-)